MMENKENFGYAFTIDKSLDKTLGNSTKINLKSSSISSLASQLEIEKEYLAKLKLQRQKTERLHAEYVKLKRQKDKIKEDHDGQLSSTKNKLIECQSQLSKKTDEWRQLDRQIQRLRSELDKLNRQKNDSLNSIKFSYQQSFMDLKHNIDTLNQSLDAKNKQLNTLKKTHSTRINQLEVEKNQLQANWKNSQQKLRQAQQRRKQIEKTVTDLNKKVQDLNGEVSRTKNQLDLRIRELTTIKSNTQRIQFQHQASCRKVNDLENQIIKLEQRVSEKEREIQKMRTKLQDTEQKLKLQKNQNQKMRSQQQELRDQNSNLKLQICKREQIIREYSQKVLKREDQDMWKQKLAQKQHENEQLMDIIKQLREENDALMNHWRQKQLLERQRKSIQECEWEQIKKFENLLQNVK